ncbi:hypothetical protein ABT299_11540 [Spirillospora sp. NPDC000708]
MRKILQSVPIALFALLCINIQPADAAPKAPISSPQQPSKNPAPTAGQRPRALSKEMKTQLGGRVRAGSVPNSCTDMRKKAPELRKKGIKRYQCMEEVTPNAKAVKDALTRAAKAQSSQRSIASSSDPPPSDCGISVWKYTRTATCAVKGYSMNSWELDESGIPIKLIGRLQVNVFQFAYALESGPLPTGGYPDQEYVYRVDIDKDIPDSFGAISVGATVSAQAQGCERDASACDWSPATQQTTGGAKTSLTGGRGFPLQPVDGITTAYGDWDVSPGTANPPALFNFSTPNISIFFETPGGSDPASTYYPSPPSGIRCDAISGRITPGCVYTEYTPDFTPDPNYPTTGIYGYTLDGPYRELAKHIYDAQIGRGVPGLTPGAGVNSSTGYALRKNDGAGEADANRTKACGNPKPPAGQGDSCDEFPFASTQEGAAAPNGPGYSCRMIDENQNSPGGTLLSWWYTKYHILRNDPFYVTIPKGTFTGNRTWHPNTTNTCSYPDKPPSSPAPQTGLNLSAGNRRAPITGLYDWSKAGYLQGGDLPGDSDFGGTTISAEQMSNQFGVKPDDGVDDSAGIQAAIDYMKTNCTSGSYTHLCKIILPGGTLEVSKQIWVDVNYLVISGQGTGSGGTRMVFTPDATTRYDTVTPDGSRWDQDCMTVKDDTGKTIATAGWLWPGRGLFRVQSRAVHPDYQTAYDNSPEGRKDIFEGTVNVHWKAGAKLRDKPGDTGFAARTGDSKVYLDVKTPSKVMANIKVGGYINIRAANTMNFYQQMQALPTDFDLQDMHMRQQIFQITGVGNSSTDKWITIDKPLEYDVPVNSTSDGSDPIPAPKNPSPCADAATTTAPYASKASPIVDPILGVGIENLTISQNEPSLNRGDAVHNYGNMDPAGAMHGIVLKWAINDWVKNVHTDMTGSHPIVTEEAKNLTITDNYLDGSWNKGKGGNGYFRGSRVWDSIYAGNITRNLRHFTFQWSASGNVAIGNDIDSDFNLHGGWERNNLIEDNRSNVPFAHRSANCFSNCGDEGDSPPDNSNWYPIWWAAGRKAVKWSGSSGYNNVFFNNTMTKETEPGGAYTPFYADRTRIYEFGWNCSSWQPLGNGSSIDDWAGHETEDFTNGGGVCAQKTDQGPSLFLKNVG